MGNDMRAILDPVMNRLVALVVALAVVSAPIALEVCQIACLAKAMPLSMARAVDPHAGHHHKPADHASCHEHGGATPQLSPVSGLCDHGTDATPSLVAARNSDTVVSLLATVPPVDPITLFPARESVSPPESSRAGRLGIPLAIPLRV